MPGVFGAVLAFLVYVWGRGLDWRGDGGERGAPKQIWCGDRRRMIRDWMVHASVIYGLPAMLGL
jgi:hypothetical protein